MDQSVIVNRGQASRGLKLADRQHNHLLQLGHPVAPADEVRGQRQRQGRGADHPDVAGGLAAHPAE
jgi:hypothetical protein